MRLPLRLYNGYLTIKFVAFYNCINDVDLGLDLDLDLDLKYFNVQSCESDSCDRSPCPSTCRRLTEGPFLLSGYDAC